MKHRKFVFFFAALLLLCVFAGSRGMYGEKYIAPALLPNVLTAAAAKADAAGNDIQLRNTDGNGSQYVFTYHDKEYQAVYTEDNWKIVNSYEISDPADMVRICEALKAVHPIHSADMKAWRTAEDMAYEWRQHNIAYSILPESSEWKKSARDVDINPTDQGKSIYDFYIDRSGYTGPK